MFEKLFLVNAAQLDKINESTTPPLNYTELYNAVIKSKLEESAPTAKLQLREWLTLYHGKSA